LAFPLGVFATQSQLQYAQGVIDKFHDLLRQQGKSITKTRNGLFRYLQKSGPVATTQFMRDNAGVADRASLYRTLIMFRQLGIIEERMIGGRHLLELTDEYDSHHHHMTCSLCGKSTAIVLEHVEHDLMDICRQHGFAADTHTIEISGVCRECQNIPKHKY
jgi:Fe2+ or Zn2+ uptake regulation protein